MTIQSSACEPSCGREMPLLLISRRVMISRSPREKDLFPLSLLLSIFPGRERTLWGRDLGRRGAGSIRGHSQRQKGPNLQQGALCLAALPVPLWVCDSSSPSYWVNLETTPQRWVKARMGGAAVRTGFTHTRPGTAGLSSLPPSPWGSAAPSPPPPHGPSLRSVSFCVSEEE